MKGNKTLWTVAGTVAALIALFAFSVVWRQIRDRKRPNFSERFEIYVRPETAPASVMEEILSSGHVLSPRSLKRAFQSQGALTSMKVGHYTVDPSSSSVYVARMLRHGWQTPVNLTLSGSIRSKGILARKIASQMLADSSEVASFLFSPDSLARIGTDTTRVFCMIIPDTYQILWTSTPSEIFDRLKETRDAFWTDRRKQQAAAQGLTPEEVSILASIVDGETRYVPEQPAIAGVYLNRLRIGMRLQADPTVAYCFGYSINRVLYRHLEVDSPYNTYRYAGLPPGPISCPPKSCLEAVLNPDRHSYLYFCADPSFNGSHRFAATPAEHRRNADAFRQALVRRNRERANSN